MKRIRTFFLKIQSAATFNHIREYLMKKYSVYCARMSGSVAEFRVGY